jgi:hypothetical protein
MYELMNIKTMLHSRLDSEDLLSAISEAYGRAEKGRWIIINNSTMEIVLRVEV